MTIKWFKEISKEDVGLAGGKGANLGEMTKAGFPIPPGFVVTAQTYKEFIEKAGIRDKIFSMLKGLDVEDTEKLQKTAKAIQKLIIATEIPEDIKEEIKEAYAHIGESEKSKAAELVEGKEEFVAVRSSATAEDLPSIAEDSHVLIKVNGKSVYDSIKNVYQEFGDGTNAVIEVAAMDGNAVKWIKAQQIYRHAAKNKKLYKIVTETGREIKITRDHSLIILDPNTLKPKIVSISELKGNEMVPVIRNIPLLNLNIKEVDVLDYVKGKDVYLENNLVYIKNNSSNWKIQNPLKRNIAMGDDFAYFLGLYCAEGSTYKNNCVIITNSNNKVMQRIEQFLQEILLYNKQKINRNSLRVYCKSLVRFLHAATGKPLDMKGKGRSCKIKKVPNFIFGCNTEIVASFLKGCFDGDGYVSKSGIEYSSTSKELIGGIVKLLELLNIDFYIRRKRSSFDIAIPSSQGMKFKEVIGLEHTKKLERLNKLIEVYNKKGTHPEFKNAIFVSKSLSKSLKSVFDGLLEKELVEVGICPLCNQHIEKTSHYKNKPRFYCKRCQKAFYGDEVKKQKVKKYVYYDEKGRFRKNLIPWNKGLISGRISKKRFVQLMKKNRLDEYAGLFRGGVMWDRIREVKEYGYNGIVYDFTVPGLENFAAGMGGIITHNTASFAGQQATFLNVKGGDDVVKATRACWASLFTARAIYYREKNKFPHERVLIAAVIQRMVNSDKSGVMFSVNPATNDESEIVIESAFGLGEAIVSGAVNPDMYIVDKESLKIKSVDIKEQGIKYVKDPRTGKTVKKKLSPAEEKQQVCDDKEIYELARLGKRIEEHYKSPQDIEWAIEGPNVYIVQSRAVTTIKKPVPEKVEEREKAEILVKGETASPGIAAGVVKIIMDVKQLDEIQKGDVLVTKMTNPDMVPAMQRAAAIVTDEGGITCHAAIVSREMGIPCIVGTGNATEILKDKEEVTVHATHGNVYAGRIEEMIKPAVEVAAPVAVAPKLVTATQVKVIMDLPEFAEKAAGTGADGVGLVRLEIMIANGGIHPAEYMRTGKREDYIKLLIEGIGGIARAFPGKPVWVRTSDMRTDEYRNLKGGEKEPKETDPMIGWHAIRRCLDEPEILKAEFEAIKRLHEAGMKNVGVMIPFVIRTREVRKAKEIMREVGLEPCEDIQFGVMIETPASCWVIEDICKEGIDFISFGTNDLTQLTLGVDRNNERIAKLFDEMHAAVLGEMEMVVKVCRKYGVETSICGQAGSRPEMAKFLVKIGIDSISANPDAVAQIREVVARSERALLLEAEREELEERK